MPITDLARTYDSKAPVVVINARTGKRQLIWAELDSNAGSPADTALLIHPAKNFREGERYIVALRKLRGADGKLLHAPRAFRLYRDRIKTDSPAFEHRRAHMEDIFRRLKARRDQARLALPGVGLHRGERALAVAADAVDPRPRLRRAGRHAT